MGGWEFGAVRVVMGGRGEEENGLRGEEEGGFM